jgi:hypothetical protein
MNVQLELFWPAALSRDMHQLLEFASEDSTIGKILYHYKASPII